MTHTPGPWRHDIDGHRIVSTAQWLVDPEPGEDGIPTSVINLLGAMGGDDSDADINLIAAAPDLLAALEAVIQAREYDLRPLHCCGPTLAYAMETAITALNKAKGT